MRLKSTTDRLAAEVAVLKDSLALADKLAGHGDALLHVAVKYDRELWGDDSRTENRHIIEFRAALAAYRKGEA